MKLIINYNYIPRIRTMIRLVDAGLLARPELSGDVGYGVG